MMTPARPTKEQPAELVALIHHKDDLPRATTMVQRLSESMTTARLLNLPLKESGRCIKNRLIGIDQNGNPTFAIHLRSGQLLDPNGCVRDGGRTNANQKRIDEGDDPERG